MFWYDTKLLNISTKTNITNSNNALQQQCYKDLVYS